MNKFKVPLEMKDQPNFINQKQMEKMMEVVNPAISNGEMVVVFPHEEGATVASGYDYDLTIRILVEAGFSTALKRKRDSLKNKGYAEMPDVAMKRAVKKVAKKGFKLYEPKRDEQEAKPADK